MCLEISLYNKLPVIWVKSLLVNYCVPWWQQMWIKYILFLSKLLKEGPFYQGGIKNEVKFLLPSTVKTKYWRPKKRNKEISTPMGREALQVTHFWAVQVTEITSHPRERSSNIMLSSESPCPLNTMSKTEDNDKLCSLWMLRSASTHLNSQGRCPVTLICPKSTFFSGLTEGRRQPFSLLRKLDHLGSIQLDNSQCFSS